MDEIEAVFNRKDMTFEEAVKYFKERVPVSASVFYRIAEKYRGLAFTVGGYTKAQILKRFYDEILAALEDGNTLSEFRSRMKQRATRASRPTKPRTSSAPTSKRPTTWATMSK